jgi:hypothetical protein
VVAKVWPKLGAIFRRPETREPFSFSVLAWLEALSILTAALWLLAAGLFSSNSGQFVPEGR